MPGYGHRYWSDRTVQHRRRQFPAFKGDTTADVVVIGGGLTGTTAAYVFAAAGLRRLPARRDLDASALVVNARTAEYQAALRKEQAARKAAGLDAPWLSATAATTEVGGASEGAIRLRDAFVHDPVRSALAFA